MQWRSGKYTLTMRDEPAYTFGSADNTHQYDHELLLSSGNQVVSVHGLVCEVEGRRKGSIVMGASRGPTSVLRTSALLTEDRCVAAVCSWIVGLSLPELKLLWKRQADTATCFGLYSLSNEPALVVHGECEISRWSLDGACAWSFSGADIFTGDIRITTNRVQVEDFEGRRYSIDLSSGQPMPRVVITGWRPGLQKVGLTKAIRAHTALGLKEAKQCTDRVLAGKPVEFDVDSNPAAVSFADVLNSLGAEAHVEL